ncbi:GNAT family N-acetyltransferase [Bacillus sp. ISL-35]|uniref:GNAT family N-acetyltransferase n=1 Tax=Bacillus sp. ISL-35 TaxID=2819122 RepID=UPI001BE506FD|nr:GNAT family N-acetyltransferase [Bacillus sp. ISL-35]MBT2680078.1 GNAT family N-acetyltransferase [Bacillus sp. ISL-35]MBT2702945.1 GNAT family N-acetyltransferase [Chryseobacterium sp. ISL-80]
MEIRKATLQDAEGIAKVHVKSWQETYKGLVSQEYLDSLKAEDRQPLWEKSLIQTSDTSPVFVAVTPGGEIVGFASFGKERMGKLNADGELYAIYILKKYQRDRIGTKLLHTGLEELLRQKDESMLVWVLKDNESRKFYESLQPVKAGEEVVEIAGQEYTEVAYVWKDLNLLNQSLIEKQSGDR